jgi:antitoxin VapB
VPITIKELALRPSTIYIVIYTNGWQGGMDKKVRRKRVATTSIIRPKRPAAKGRAAIPVSQAESEFKKASLFMNGRSQAVRLPKEFRFEGTHVWARKEGNRVILTPVDDRIERLISLMGSSPNFPDRAPDIVEPMRPEIKEYFGVSD